jgi:myo-inositol-1(or 4)-monophosphatase
MNIELNLEQLTEEVKKLAVLNGAMVRDERSKFERGKVEKKAAHDYVSYVDKESEKRLVGKLHELLPSAGFICEEGSAGLNDEEFYWIVDPLDGTTNFIHNLTPYCISIALRSKKELLIGVVYECTRNELFWAYKGSKAYLNGEEIRCTNIDKVDDALVELGFPYNAEAFRDFETKLVNRLYGNACGLRLIGACATELCYIAAGRAEARVEGLLGPWDVAAGALILMQAGGRITDFSGGDNFYSGKEVLATNGLIHDEMLRIVNDIRG